MSHDSDPVAMILTVLGENDDEASLAALRRLEATVEHACLDTAETGPISSLEDIPLDDHATFAFLAKGLFLENSALESAVLQLALIELQPTSMDDLSALFALLRPSSMQTLREYVRRAHGGAWELTDPSLGAALDRTFGLMIYADQLIEIATTIGGLTEANAETLRRLLAFRVHSPLVELRAEFIERSMAGGLDEVAAQRVWAMLLDSGDHLFGEEVALTYALLLYWDSYLEVHCGRSSPTCR